MRHKKTYMTEATVLLIIRRLKKEYPQAKIALEYTNGFELLVATILSAQCTDVRVNIVTRSLFTKYRTILDYAAADQKTFEQEIRSTGFFRNKAKNIITTAQKILKEFNGEIPDSMETLIQLPGIARKTANIILFNLFGKVEGIAVDTHVFRLSHRLQISLADNPVKVEQELMKIVPRKDWGILSYLLIDHGRKICNARKPKCSVCFLNDICPSKNCFLTANKPGDDVT